MSESQEMKELKPLYKVMLDRIEFFIGVILDPGIKDVILDRRTKTVSQGSIMMEVIKEFCGVLRIANLQAHSLEITVGLDQLWRSLSSYHNAMDVDLDEISKHLNETITHFVIQRQKAP